MRGLGWVVALLALLGGPRAGWAAPDETPVYDETGVAPAYTWTAEGGNAARSGESATPLPRGPLEVAWSKELPGTIAGEPLVWDERIVVVVQRDGTKSELHMLNRADGKAVGAPARWESEFGAAPTLWGSYCVAQTKPGGVSAFRLGRERLELKWHASVGSAARLALVGRDLYVMGSSTVACWRIGESKPRWSATGTRDKPGALPVIRGESIYFLGYDEDGNAHVSAVNRRTGESTGGKLFVGHHSGRVPDGYARLVALEGALVVLFADSIATRSGGGTNAAICPLPLSDVSLVRLHGHATASGPGFLASLIDDEGQPQLVHFAKVSGRLSGGRVLADARRLELAKPSLPITVAGGQAIVDYVRFVVRTGEVLPSIPVDQMVARPIPVRGGLLVRTAPNTLALLREVQPPAGPPVLLREDLWSAAVPEGALALVDGGVLKGPLTRDATRSTIEGTTDAKKRSQHPFAEVLAAVDAKGALLFAPGDEEAARGLELLGEAREASAYAVLARDAIAAKDLERGERALREALARGAADAVVAPLEKSLEELRKYTAAATVKPQRQEVLSAAERAIGTTRARAYWSAAASLPEKAPWLLRSRLVRAALEADPVHPESVEFVRAAVPPVFGLPPQFDARAWLELADAVQNAPVEPVPPATEDQLPSTSQVAVRRAQREWKPDLLALQSRQLLVLTDLREPARIGVCLSMGELVCRTLERLLGDATSVRPDSARLTLHLFETKDGYLAASGKRESGRGMEFTAGHYDPGANLSRIFLPDGPEAFEEVAGTYAHELAHHWVSQRCSLFRESELARQPALTPGFWIVEGLADFVAEGLYDVRRHRADMFNPRAHSLDMVANASRDQLIEWPLLFGLNHAFFHQLDKTRPLVIPARWRLGWLQNPTQISMFYAQSAAVCHYLFGVAGGKSRDLLRTLVREHYTGTTTNDHILKRMGMTPDALGQAVVGYARAMQSGQVPRPPPLGG
jgi:hypothetical protein